MACQLADIPEGFTYEGAKVFSDFIKEKTCHRPKIAVVCGTGLAPLGDVLQQPDVIPYEEIPGFPTSSAPGHKSRFLIGTIDNVEVMLMQGRFHFYDGCQISQCAIHIRMMKLFGIDTIIITNAAGGINESFKVGDIMILEDHLNVFGLAGVNPLRGPNDSRFGPRFPAMNGCYDDQWIELGLKVASEMENGPNVTMGVYTAVGGPNYETPAEIRMLKKLGADAVGMSTIPEAIVAQHCGMRVFAFSVITNKSNSLTRQERKEKKASVVPPSEEEVAEVAEKNTKLIQNFARKLIVEMKNTSYPNLEINC